MADTLLGADPVPAATPPAAGDSTGDQGQSNQDPNNQTTGSPAGTDGQDPNNPAGGNPQNQNTGQNPENKDGQDEKKDEDQKQTDAPEQYTDFTVPEGATFDNGLMDEFKAMAKEDNLSQEKAQKYVDLALKNAQASAEAFGKQVFETYKTTVDGWKEQTKKDLGANWEQEVATAVLGLEAVGGVELRQMAEEYGWGSHPAFVKAFIKVGKMFKEDGFVSGSNGSSSQFTPQGLYGKSNMNP